MIWPFRRRRKQKPLPPINEDWRAGDLAECISEGSWSFESSLEDGPAKGQICRVTKVVAGHLFGTDQPAYGLGFVGFGYFYRASDFRKLRPVHEACDVGFAALIKRPKREGIDA